MNVIKIIVLIAILGLIMWKERWFLVRIFENVYANKKYPFRSLLLIIILVGVIASYCTYINWKENNPLIVTSFLNLIVFFASSICLWREKRNFSYITIFLLETLLYIEIYYFWSSLYRSGLKKFSYDPKKYTFVLDKHNLLVNDLFWYFFGLLVIIIAIWIISYLIITKAVKIQEIYSIELKIIFIKSVIQSIVSFIAIFSLTTSGLKKDYLLTAMYIYSYATFIYPILDLSKYEHQKEIEQQKDKNKVIAYFYE